MRILIINDGTQCFTKLIEQLGKHSYQNDLVDSVKDGLYYIGVRQYDLVVSRWELDDGCADEIITKLKEKHPNTPIIIFSDKAQHEIEAFKCGSDDYVSYPFNDESFFFRMKARMRVLESSLIEFDDLIIIPNEERITFKGADIEIKGKPFEVLTHLARHKEAIVSKEQLLSAIWHEPELVTPNVIEVAINQIRQKIDKPLKIKTIETVRRRGYRFCYCKN